MSLEVNLKNLLNALHKLTEVDGFGLRLDVPDYEIDKMRKNFPMIEDRKREILKWWLNNDSNPTWEKVAANLRAMSLPVLADEVAEASKGRIQHKPSKKDLKRWEENFRKITLLDKEVEQSSEHLKDEWEKGENEWHEYLKKLEEIEDCWSYLVKTRQIYENRGNHLKYFELKESLFHRIERGKKLRELHGEAAEHQCGLQNTETELNLWEKELVKHIEQMENLGERFAGETEDCRKCLERSREQLQTCREQISECRNELTKPKRKLQKYYTKLTECEVSLWRCRNGLNRSHSQITECIEELKKSSKSLPVQIKTLVVAAGGLLGVGYQVGVGPRAAPEVSTEAAAGTAAGVAATGSAANLQIGPIAVGMFGAIIVALLCDTQLEKTSLREKLRTREELICCRNAIEKCSEVLQKNEKELKSLQNDFRKLKVTFKAV